MHKLLFAILLAISLLQSAILAGASTGTGDDAITYRIDERVTAEDEAYIREGIRLGQDYLKVLDRYSSAASAAGAGFVEIQNAMLFATVGQREE